MELKDAVQINLVGYHKKSDSVKKAKNAVLI